MQACVLTALHGALCYKLQAKSLCTRACLEQSCLRVCCKRTAVSGYGHAAVIKILMHAIDSRLHCVVEDMHC